MMRLLRIRDLEYFIAIAEHGSFSKAAQACGISQPTLSAQVRRMEDLLGVTLLERRHGAELDAQRHRLAREADLALEAQRRSEKSPPGERPDRSSCP